MEQGTTASASRTKKAVTKERRRQPLNAVVRGTIQHYFELTGKDEQQAGGLYHFVFAETERAMLEVTLEYTMGNQVWAAQVLGISRSALRKKLKDYGLIRPKSD